MNIDHDGYRSGNNNGSIQNQQKLTEFVVYLYLKENLWPGESNVHLRYVFLRVEHMEAFYLMCLWEKRNYC